MHERRGRLVRAAPHLEEPYAEGGTRTPTGLRPLRPERSASTSSTTSAREPKRIGAPGERQRSPRGKLCERGHFAHMVVAPILFTTGASSIVPVPRSNAPPKGRADLR